MKPTQSILRKAGWASAGALAFAMAAPAQAVTTTAATTSVWNFTGNCTDCAAKAGTASFDVSGTLTLQDYVAGTAITDENFVSFVYSGSNLIPGYSVSLDGAGTQDDWKFLPLFADAARGHVSGVAGDELFVIWEDGLYFEMKGTGDWSTCVRYGPDCRTGQFPNDFGTGGQLAAPATNPVPEPSTYALMALGLGALGLASRRRRQAA